MARRSTADGSGTGASVGVGEEAVVFTLGIDVGAHNIA
jgi:hypothetical protein